MRIITPIVLCLVGLSASGAEAQRSVPVDSLVQEFIEHGVSGWQPHQLYNNCPALDTWQRRGIELLMSADLSPLRAADLAVAWMPALRSCGNANLEQWYFRNLEAELQAGGRNSRVLNYWLALQHGDTPAIREYLWRLMTDEARPEEVRNSAGVSYFVRFAPAERRREYLRAFETMRLPSNVASGQTTVELKHDANGLLDEVSKRIRANPELIEQSAFTLIVESSHRFASGHARAGLADALVTTMKRPGLTDAQRQRIANTAQFIKQQRQ